jgi:hypothetical protein
MTSHVIAGPAVARHSGLTDQRRRRGECMNAVFPAPLLRVGLTLDAAGSGAMAVLQLAATAQLAAAMQLPQPLLLGTGLFMLGYAALTGWMVRLVVFGNVGWAVAAAALPLLGWVAPNAWGLGFLAVHAVSVLVFAALQGPGLARSPRAPAVSVLTETSGRRNMAP